MTEPITTELRGVMSHTTMAGIPLVELGEYEFASRCDAIDAVHANLERENESLRRELDRTRGEWDYWESTHVELPKDADGMPVHIGDVMVYADGNTCPLPVVALVPPAVFLTDDGPRYADMCRHAPDTWERIIRDAICEGMARQRNNDSSECCDRANPMNNDALVARCKALAGDAE